MSNYELGTLGFSSCLYTCLQSVPCTASFTLTLLYIISRQLIFSTAYNIQEKYRTVFCDYNILEVCCFFFQFNFWSIMNLIHATVRKAWPLVHAHTHTHTHLMGLQYSALKLRNTNTRLLICRDFMIKQTVTWRVTPKTPARVVHRLWWVINSCNGWMTWDLFPHSAAMHGKF